ncbi:MAG TPA: IS630 family transposase, partial [Colwellia sp.]|nr:IS630 family transposase [Colwellia sp.]
TAKEFRDKIDEFFSETLPTIGDILPTRINDNFQVLKYAS